MTAYVKFSMAIYTGVKVRPVIVFKDGKTWKHGQDSVSGSTGSWEGILGPGQDMTIRLNAADPEGPNITQGGTVFACGWHRVDDYSDYNNWDSSSWLTYQWNGTTATCEITGLGGWTVKTTAGPVKVQDHFYTTDQSGEAAPKVGYKQEGICGYVYHTQVPNSVPFYRFYNAGLCDHFYTQSANGEGAPDWKPEGIACYLPSSAADGAVPLYRWWNDHDHFYTTNPSGEAAPAGGYRAEGQAGFIYSTQVAGTVPLYRWYISRN